MLLIETLAEPGAVPDDCLVLTYEFRCKNRLRTRLDSGEEVGLFLPRGTILQDGQLLLASGGQVVQVQAAMEPIMEARSDNPLTLTQAAYHLGNRHVALQIQNESIRFLCDHVLGKMVRGLGLEVQEMRAPFEPERGAYGSHGSHAHGHPADGEGQRARIHDMTRLRS